MSNRTIFLHLGLPKTGTTSIQESLFASRAELAARGLLYPDLGSNHTVPLVTAFSARAHGVPANLLAGIDTAEAGQKAAEACRRRLDQMLATGWTRAILSAEGAVYLPAERLALLRDALLRHADRVVAVLCFRDPLRWRISQIQQALKTGATIDGEVDRLSRPDAYRKFARRVECSFQRDNMSLMVFEELTEHPAGLPQGFLSALDPALGDLHLRDIRHRNGSMSLTAAQALDRLNGSHPVFLDGKRNRRRSLLLDRALRRLPGPGFALTAPQIARMQPAVTADRDWMRQRLKRSIWDGAAPTAPQTLPVWAGLEALASAARVLGRVLP